MYSQVQDSEQYGEDTTLLLSFNPINEIPRNGYIELQWPESVALYGDTACNVTTSKLITTPGVCVIDLASRTIRIDGAFD